MRCLGLLRQAGRAQAAPVIPGLGDKTELARRSPSTSLQARAADADAARGTRQGVPVGDAGSPHPMAVNEGAPSYNPTISSSQVIILRTHSDLYVVAVLARHFDVRSAFREDFHLK